MEFVFVVPRSELFRDCYPQGLVPFGHATGDAAAGDADRAHSWPAFEAAMRDHGFFVERARAEETPAWQQIIPYTIVLARGRSAERDQEGILLMRRLKQGGEARLHDKLSIGVGGHINPVDLIDEGADPRARGKRLLERGAQRELSEELVLEGATHIETIGFLNDDANAVGAVHVGIVQVLHLDGSVTIREDDVLEGRLVAPEELQRLRREGANFETWSSLLVEQLDTLLPASVPH